MKRHKIQKIIKKQGGHSQVIFSDGMSVFWPREYVRDLNVGTVVYEHKHKTGQTVAFSWKDNLRFVEFQPTSFNDAVDFIEKFKLFDSVAFNNALVRTLDYPIDQFMFPDTEKFAHNIVLFGIKSRYGKSR